MLINKGIGKSVEFRGLKGNYLYLSVGSVVGGLLLLLILGLLGLNPYLTTVIALGAAAGGVYYCMQQSAEHGVSGMLKKEATRKQPKAIVIKSTKPFAQLRRETKQTKSRGRHASPGR